MYVQLFVCLFMYTYLEGNMAYLYIYIYVYTEYIMFFFRSWRGDHICVYVCVYTQMKIFLAVSTSWGPISKKDGVFDRGLWA